jgi:hypothetical protein
LGPTFTGGIEHVSIGGQLVTGYYFDVLGVTSAAYLFR